MNDIITVSVKKFLSHTPKNIVCDLTSIFDDISMIKSASASPSIQLLAKIKPSNMKKLIKYYDEYKSDKVFIKMYPETLNKDEKRFEVEKAIYQYLNKYSIMNTIPNVIKYIMSFHCNSFDKFNIGHLKLNDDQKYYFESLNKINYLVLERTTGTTLVDILKAYVNNDTKYSGFYKYFPSIFFQMIYTLTEFAHNNIRHNDCHSGNWFIEDMGSDQELFYFISEDVYFRIVTRYWVKIYDFDLSTSTDNKFRNPLTYVKYSAFCENYGICDTVSNKFDLFLVLRDIESTFVYKGESKNIEEYIIKIRRKIILDESLLQNDICCKGFRYRLCTNAKEECDKDTPLDDNRVLPIQKAILLDELLQPGYVERYDFNGKWTWTMPLSQIESLDTLASTVIKNRFYCSTSIKSKNPAVYMANLIYKNN